MIIIIIGGIGSGKTLSMISEIVSKDQFAYTNFNMKNWKKYHRLKYEDIILMGEKAKDHRVNWDFWENVRKNHKQFSICIDECHNILHSRTSMAKGNILISKWLSQVRKICSDSPFNHLYLISQSINRIDSAARDLAHIVIKCEKFNLKKGTTIRLSYYDGVENFMLRNRVCRKVFVGNKYFKYYNTNDFITFDDSEIYV